MKHGTFLAGFVLLAALCRALPCVGESRYKMPVYKDPTLYAVLASDKSDDNTIQSLSPEIQFAYRKFMERGYSESELFPTEDRSTIEIAHAYESLLGRGVRPENTRVLIGDGNPDYSSVPDSIADKLRLNVRPATKAEIKKAVAELTKKTDSDDAFLFYGLSNNENGATGFSAWDSTLSTDELKGMFDDDANLGLLYFDQCYPQFSELAEGNYAVVTASQENRRSFSDRKNSFGRFFLDALGDSATIQEAYSSASISFNEWQENQKISGYAPAMEAEAFGDIAPQITGNSNITSLPLFQKRGYEPLSAGEIDSLRSHYKEFLNYVESERTALEKRHRNGENVIEDARHFIYHTLNDVLLPAWVGTQWNMYGTTDTPGKGDIACGHFVARVLRHVGFDVNDSATPEGLGVHASLDIARSVTGDITMYSRKKPEEIEEDLKKKGNDVFILGHDCGAGFLVNRNGETYVCNSTHHSISGQSVVYVPIEQSPDVAYSGLVVAGDILNDQTIKNWLEKEKIKTVRTNRKR